MNIRNFRTLLYFVVVSTDGFYHILQEYFTGADAIIQLWSLRISRGPLFTKRLDVLPTNIVKSRHREIQCYNDRTPLKFDSHLGSAAAEVPVKY